jgi:hypothetical protein
MSFADSWSSQIGEATTRLATQMGTSQARYQVDYFRFLATIAAIDIAASPYPGAALLDMLVLVTLTRMVWEEHWMPHVYGQPAVGMVTTLRKLEADIWALGAQVLTPTQRQELQDVLRAWRTTYPDKTTVSFIRFSDFGDLGRKPALEKARKAGGLLAPITQVTQAADEIRILGERALYVLLRTQELLNLRLRVTVQELLATPEMAQLFANVTGFREVSERYAALFETLPAQFTAHTQVMIDQTMEQVRRQSAALIDRLMQQVSAERQDIVEQVLYALDQERQVLLAQLLQGVAQERQALLGGVEQVLNRVAWQGEQWLRHGFVLLAALILLFFVARLAYHYAAYRPVETPSWRWTACAGLGGVALLLVVTALAYVQRGVSPMSASPAAPRAAQAPVGTSPAPEARIPHERPAQRRDGAAGGQGVERATHTTPGIAAPAAPPGAPITLASAGQQPGAITPPALPPGQAAQGTPSPARQYVVQPGDTLSRIARSVYGDVSPQAWQRIYDANKAVIGADPSQLRLGVRLTIPES